MLRKQENTDQLQVLQAKVNKLETEINTLKASLKNSQHQKLSNPTSGFKQHLGREKFSEKQFADKVLKIFSSSFKSSTPNSFMR